MIPSLYKVSTQVTCRLSDDLKSHIVPWHSRYLRPVKHVFERFVQRMELDDSLVGHVLAWPDRSVLAHSAGFKIIIH